MLSDWLEKYYSDWEGGTMIQAVEHSLKKWIGLMPKILKHFGLAKNYRHIFQMGGKRASFGILSYTCSLCIKYHDETKRDDCEDCPFVLKLGHNCHVYYREWKNTGNPEPMIKALKEIKDEISL